MPNLLKTPHAPSDKKRWINVANYYLRTHQVVTAYNQLLSAQLFDNMLVSPRPARSWSVRVGDR